MRDVVQIEPLEVAIDLHLIDKLVSLSGRVTHMFEASVVQTKPSRFHRIQSSAALNTLHPLLEDPSDDGASSRAAQSAMIKPDRASNRFVPASMRLSVGGMDSPEPAARARMAAVGSDHVSAISQSLPWYFERLIIRPTAVRLSTSAPSQLMASPLAYLATLQDAQLRFDAVQLGDLLLPLSDLTGSLGSQYKKAAYTNLFRILLSSRVLIAPSTMLQAIMSGLHGFYFESSKGFYEVCNYSTITEFLAWYNLDCSCSAHPCAV